MKSSEKTIQDLTTATAKVCANEGDHEASINNVEIDLFGDRPSISIQMVIESAKSRFFCYHNMSLNSTPSVEIGCKQVANAFPTMVKDSAPNTVLNALMTQTDDFVGLACSVTISTQIDRNTGSAKLSQKGLAYPNVKLNSALRNMSKKDAASALSELGFGQSSKANLAHWDKKAISAKSV